MPAALAFIVIPAKAGIQAWVNSATQQDNENELLRHGQKPQ
jgi:hypothetical protein